MLRWARKVVTDEDGATVTEYALLLVSIALVVIWVVYLFGGAVEGLFESFMEALAS